MSFWNINVICYIYNVSGHKTQKTKNNLPVVKKTWTLKSRSSVQDRKKIQRIWSEARRLKWAVQGKEISTTHEFIKLETRFYAHGSGKAVHQTYILMVLYLKKKHVVSLISSNKLDSFITSDDWWNAAYAWRDTKRPVTHEISTWGEIHPRGNCPCLWGNFCKYSHVLPKAKFHPEVIPPLS